MDFGNSPFDTGCSVGSPDGALYLTLFFGSNSPAVIVTKGARIGDSSLSIYFIWGVYVGYIFIAMILSSKINGGVRGSNLELSI